MLTTHGLSFGTFLYAAMDSPLPWPYKNVTRNFSGVFGSLWSENLTTNDILRIDGAFVDDHNSSSRLLLWGGFVLHQPTSQPLRIDWAFCTNSVEFGTQSHPNDDSQHAEILRID